MDNWMSANRLKLNVDKTELLWAGTRYNMSMLNDSSPSLQLNNVTVKASQHVRVLGVHLSSDLRLDKHISSVSATCFYHLRQLRRVDYCNAILAAATKTTTDRLQRVLNAATPRSLIRDYHDRLTTDAPGVTLAGHSRASKLQAGSTDPPVSARQGASVPIKLLYSSQSSSFAAASTLRCTSSSDRTSTSSQHLRSAGICCRWSDDV